MGIGSATSVRERGLDKETERVLVHAEQLGECFGVAREESDEGEAQLSLVFHACLGVVHKVVHEEREEGFLELVERVQPGFLRGAVARRLTLWMIQSVIADDGGKQCLPLGESVFLVLGQSEKNGSDADVHVAERIQHVA